MRTGAAGSPGRLSYEIRVGGEPPPAVLAALQQRARSVPRQVVVVVEADAGELAEILSVIAVRGVDVESVRSTPVPVPPSQQVVTGLSVGGAEGRGVTRR